MFEVNQVLITYLFARKGILFQLRKLGSEFSHRRWQSEATNCVSFFLAGTAYAFLILKLNWVFCFLHWNYCCCSSVSIEIWQSCFQLRKWFFSFHFSCFGMRNWWAISFLMMCDENVGEQNGIYGEEAELPRSCRLLGNRCRYEWKLGFCLDSCLALLESSDMLKHFAHFRKLEKIFWKKLKILLAFFFPPFCCCGSKDWFSLYIYRSKFFQSRFSLFRLCWV